MTLKTTVHFKMKSTKFLTELRARGLQITEKEAKYLMEIAVSNYRENQVKPILKREKMAHYLILALAFSDATNEHLLQPGNIAHGALIRPQRQPQRQPGATTRPQLRHLHVVAEHPKPVVSNRHVCLFIYFHISRIRL